ncbi:hypothetical protein PDE_08168 [Penicillium oxalicum 114-2]|uniref:Uncharacterized protein n=1 Tax=Penicillium oxalicum (strain 114-2 / CGMCC 5302) TaxID=933388 RepID=S7ZWR3_PENO1|nr:hypothetical protein PDE_08168 [Penicillium oxalicum 114-2]
MTLWNSSPVHIPLRISSRNQIMENRENKVYDDRRASKAQRILGTNLPLLASQREWEKPQKSRRESVQTSGRSSKQRNQNSAFAAFPSPRDTIAPPPNLRVRASSPLLGHDYRSQESAPSAPKPSKKVHQSGSSSTLFSYFSSKESNKSPSVASPPSPQPASLQPHIRHELGFDPRVTYKQQSRGKTRDQDAEKEAKRKLRPSRLDLSILFPKPRNAAPPLLSPHRMTKSPSPASSVVSDYPSARLDRESTFLSPKKFGESLPPRSPGSYCDGSKSHKEHSDLQSIPESKDSDWYNQSLERTVGTSEIDIALDRYAGRRSLFSRSSVYTNSRDQLRQEPPRTTEGEYILRREQAPATSRPDDIYLVAARQPKSTPRHRASTTESSKSRGGKSSMSRQSSKSTLRNKDLQNSSVLCLSSSEDEEENVKEEVKRESTRLPKTIHRDRMASTPENEGIASTARAVPAAAIKKIDRVSSNSSHGSYSNTRQQSNQKHISLDSTGDMSTTAGRMPTSARSSNIPIIAEPDILSQFPQQPSRTPQELKELNRRSRLIAVTRQEQDLLEAMRQRKGKITPSILQFNGNTAESDGNSLASGPSQASSCDVHTSFLRLSAAFPSVQSQRDQGAIHTDSDSPPSQSSGSDTEQTNDNPLALSRLSAGYTESLPSPAASVASPLTPTLPNNRFSSLPSAKPPPRGLPPAIPESQKVHTRRRTDSSEAIMIDDRDGPQRKHGLPTWAYEFDWGEV